MCASHTLMDTSEQNSKSDINRVKYFLAFMKYSRECLEDAFYLLYATWGRGKNYTTLQEFCVDCLGVKKEQLLDILCQPVTAPQQDSVKKCTAFSSDEKRNQKTSDNQNPCYSNGVHSPPLARQSFSHMIRSSLRRRRSEVVNAQRDVTLTPIPRRKFSLGGEKNHSGGTSTFYIREGMHVEDDLTSKDFCGSDGVVNHNVQRSQDANTGIPKSASTSHVWDVAKRLLLPTASVKKAQNSINSPGLGRMNHTSQPVSPSPSHRSPPPPTRKTSSVHEDDDKSLKDDAENVINVIREAKYKLKSSFFFLDSGQESSILNADPDPTQMSLSVLVILLTKVFPEVSPNIHHLINQLQRLVYAVCYQDLVFDDLQLKFRLQNMSVVISKVIAAVVISCTGVTEKFIAEVSEKLRASRQRLRRAQVEYDNHLKWVEKTREELEVVQKELKEAQAKNFRALRAYSRSWSQEADDPHKTAITCGSQDSCDSLAKGITRISDGTVDRMDSGNISLSEELKGREALTERKDDYDDCYSDSLLVSVMREVALIEKRHNSFRPFDKKLKMMVRRSHQSVILTKREMRERLNSNVSAEEGAMSKEEVLSVRRAQTRMLSKDVRKLRRNLEDLQSDEKSIMARINHDLEALIEDELVEAAECKGRQSVQQLQEGSGQLLGSSRQEAKRFASRARITDLGEWVMRRVYATMPLKKVYSRVRPTDTRDSFHITNLLGTDSHQPPVIIVSGPKGSGKTCMAHYLLQQWESNTEAIKSNIHEFDLVIYGTVSNIISSGSWVQYLREHIFCLTLMDFRDEEVYEAFNTMSVLYLLDVDAAVPQVTKILDDVLGHLGRNQVIITTRPDGENAITEATRRHSIDCQRVKMCPMTLSAIQEYSAGLLSLVEQDRSVVSSMVKHFSRLVNSIKTVDEVLYPLPMMYLLYLWRINPCHALQATSVSRLVSQVIVVAESTLREALKALGKNDSRAAMIRAEECTKKLCEIAWELVSGPGWPHDGHFVLESENMFLTNPAETSSFSALITMKESSDGRQRVSFLHPWITEIMCGFFLTQQRLLHKGSSLLRRRENLEKYCVPEIKRYKEVLPHAAGALVYNKHKLEDAKEIAVLFFNSLSDKEDMIAWHTLLGECGFLPTMCAAVSSALAGYGCWTVAHHSQETNCALADMLKKEAYRPQTVVISQEGKSYHNSECVIRALATCSSTFVHLRQESQFYSWGEPATSDSLIEPLQPAGTLQEFWGHLGVEGALALRHFHQLTELYVRVSSYEALASLTYSIALIGRSLRYLYIRLDLPNPTPVSNIEPLNFKGRNLWLRMKGVEDENLGWVKEITSKLSDWYTEVLLEKSRLSPPALQELKQSLPNTSVHMSS